MSERFECSGGLGDFKVRVKRWGYLEGKLRIMRKENGMFRV